MVSPFDTPILPLLRVVFESILQVFLLCVAGYILARRGILDKKTQKQLNRVNVSLFTPALLFSKVAFFLSPAKLRELWIIPIFFVVITTVSMTVAYVLSTLFRLRKSQRSFAIASAMFMNSNSLPIALMQSLVVSVPGLKWGDDDNKDAMLGRALTYLVLHSTLGMILRWSYGVRLLAQADTDPVDPHHVTAHDEAAPLLGTDAEVFTSHPDEQMVHRHKPHLSGTSSPSVVVEDVDRLKPRSGRQDQVFYSFPNTPRNRSSSLMDYDDSTTAGDEGSDVEEDDEEFPARRYSTEPTSSRLQSSLRRTKHRVAKYWHKFNEFMTVPLWASLASLIVACVRPLQHALDDHLPPVKGALSAAGACSIPVTLVVLGAYFWTPEEPSEEKKHKLPTHRLRSNEQAAQSEVSLVASVREMFRLENLRRSGSGDENKRPGESKTVFVAVASRMLVTPLLLLPLMALSAKFNWQTVLEDPVFVVANVLLIASPPALTLAQITQAASGDSFERLISRTIFWAYCVVTPPSTIVVVVVGLLLSKL
ncbi:hypothetical protein JAAARDRAFT_664661 [Jaapia argillacea MUCL 33604]|uniref:Transporter n=1 Tax=Jaapia argillacea MUCL 33604 TaxID=933084 RepID=A0A067PWU5_9AGAM|nr:hypothetical protein JAAARDRAFT_664661 [Jaapia argillacea MUCL 33604]